MGNLYLNAADLARLFRVSPQQISRWKADGVFRFSDSGMARASECLGVIARWPDDRKGRLPGIVEIWKEMRADGVATDDYITGYKDGMDSLADVVFSMLAEYDYEKCHAFQAAAAADFEAWKMRMVAEGHLKPEPDADAGGQVEGGAAEAET